MAVQKRASTVSCPKAHKRRSPTWNVVKNSYSYFQKVLGNEIARQTNLSKRGAPVYSDPPLRKLEATAAIPTTVQQQQQQDDAAVVEFH